jgi:hypothetical protein
VGILVLTGLSLLFPTFVSLATVRRKRHAEDGKQKHILERGAWPAHSVEQPRPQRKEDYPALPCTFIGVVCLWSKNICLG